MRRHTRCALFLTFALAPVLASAVELQPGVWEVSAHNMQVGGQAMPGMDQILAQMQNLPPAQRQAWADMFRHYVFEADDQTSSHIPPDSRRMLGPIDDNTARAIRAQLLKRINR